MDPLVVGYSGIFFMFVLLALGVPIAVAMGTVGVVGMYLGAGELFTMG